MLQYLFDDLFVLDKGDNPHLPMAFGTISGSNLINFLNKSGPVLPEIPGKHLILHDSWDSIISSCLFSHAPGFVRIVPIISDSLLIPAGDMGERGRLR